MSPRLGRRGHDRLRVATAAALTPAGLDGTVQAGNWHAVADYADLPEGLTPVAVGDEVVLLVRIGEGLHACAATCPHKFTALSDGTLAPGRLTCPLHNATFDLSTGRPYPGSEFAGNLPVYPLRVRDGVVEVML